MSADSLPACIYLALFFGNVREEQGVAADDSFPSARSIAQDLGYRGIDEACLLAFRSQIDDRPLFVESALVAVKMVKGTWRLAHVYRHPKETYTGCTRWDLSIVFDAPVSPSKNFDHRPSKDEVERFVEDSWWKFRASEGFRLVRGRVFSEAWKKAFGYRPAHQFPKPDAQPRATAAPGRPDQ